MKPNRTPIWAALVAVMLPQPLLAIESGVNAVDAAEEVERLNLSEWAYLELKDLFVHGNEKLDPLLPHIDSGFNLLDAEIAQFIAEGQSEQVRLQNLIDRIGEPEQEVQAEFNTQDLMPVKQPEPIVINGVQYVPVEASKAPVEVGMTDEGRLILDTTGSIDLPDLTIDPRDGGEYTSEIEVVQEVLDLVQLVQDQVPAPIQSVPNELFNNLAGNLQSDN